MNVSKEVYERCQNMIERELADATFKLTQNRRKINLLAKEQRILKAQKAKLYEMARIFKTKNGGKNNGK